MIQGGFGRQTTRLIFLIGYTFDKNHTKKKKTQALVMQIFFHFEYVCECVGSYTMM